MLIFLRLYRNLKYREYHSCSENGKLVVSGLPTGAEYVLFDVVGRVLEKGVSESDVLLFHPEMRGVYAVRVVVDGVAEVLKTIF